MPSIAACWLEVRTPGERTPPASSGRSPTPRSGDGLQISARGAFILPDMDHDAAHKYIYALPEVTADLLRLVLPDWAHRLDFATLGDASSEFFDARHGKRVSDMVWRVRLRGGQPGSGERPGILVLVEFQSKVDRRMARRMREYADLLLARLVRRGLAQREGGLPWVLPIVVYNGSGPWTAFGRSSDLAPLPWAGMERALALVQPQKYVLLSAGGALTGAGRLAQDWPLGNRVAATVRLQRSGALKALLPRLLAEAARFPGPANESFRQALHAWARALWADRTGGEGGFPSFDELEGAGGARMTTLLEASWDQWEAGVREQGLERGRAEQGARLLARQAALKFGAGAAKRLAALLEGLPAGEDLERVGDWIIECAAEDELLSRVTAMRKASS